MPEARRTHRKAKEEVDTAVVSATTTTQRGAAWTRQRPCDLRPGPLGSARHIRVRRGRGAGGAAGCPPVGGPRTDGSAAQERQDREGRRIRPYSTGGHRAAAQSIGRVGASAARG